MNDVDPSGEVEREVERLSAVLVPYICERTGFSAAQVKRMLDVQEEFWEHQPHVSGRMFILGFEVNGDNDSA